mgnify:CR=1 FL=1
MPSLPKIKEITVKGRIKLLHALPYHGCMVYVRQIDQEVFMYDVVYKDQIYSSYVIMKPRKGKKTLSKNDIQKTVQLVLAGAFATLDMLLDIKVSAEDESKVKVFNKVTKQIQTVN